TRARCAEGSLCNMWYEGSLCWRLVGAEVIPDARDSRSMPLVEGVIPDARDTNRTPVVEGVILCRCGRLMLMARRRRRAGRRTRRCSRPLRARDRWFLNRLLGVRSQQLNGRPFGTRGGVIAIPYFVLDRRFVHPEGALCHIRRAEARCAGVI